MPGPADTFGKGITKRGVSSAGQSLSTLVVRLGPLKPWHVCFPRSEAGSAALCRTAVAAQLAGSASSTRACGCRAWRRRTGCTIRGEGGASGSTAPSLAVWQLSQCHLGEFRVQNLLEPGYRQTGWDSPISRSQGVHDHSRARQDTCTCNTQNTKHHPYAGFTHSNERAWLRARPPPEASACMGINFAHRV